MRLKNPPLVEVIFEMHWQFAPTAIGVPYKTPYRLLVESLYEALKNDYPYYESLPQAEIPELLAEGQVQHRYRKKPKGWPLVQIGPGIFTLNETEGYLSWTEFRPTLHRTLNNIESIFSFITVDQVSLRYLNSLNIVEGKSLTALLNEWLKIQLSLNATPDSVETTPFEIGLQMAFRSFSPEGILYLSLGKHNVRERELLLWELGMSRRWKTGESATPATLLKWLDEAHARIEECFFRMIEGELRRQFEQ